MIKVAELFAGVGGFHLGLRNASSIFQIIWANQFEPSRKNQFAYRIYEKNFPDTNISNEDISKVDKKNIPDINMIVGGFPCQDYSVASTKTKGLYGKKGVLWWDISDTIQAKWPQFLFLENVDRLLASPGVKTKNPGRDFGMILRTLYECGYSASWKVINAADYGFPQRRRRTFIFASREDTKHFKDVEKAVGGNNEDTKSYLETMSPLSSSLTVDQVGELHRVDLTVYDTLENFSDNFTYKGGFEKTGVMVHGKVVMAKYQPQRREPTPLKTIIKPNSSNQSLYLSPSKIEKFAELRSSKKTEKTGKTGDYTYKYAYGAMKPFDSLDLPARTMVTSEHSVSRMTHIVKDPGNCRLRLISPEEAELINTFPEGWSALDGVTPSQRYFVMGNALVVDLVTEISREIAKLSAKENFLKPYSSNRKVKKVLH